MILTCPCDESVLTLSMIISRFIHVAANGILFFLWLSTKNEHFFSFISISWRLITLQYCSGFCHTLT